MTATSLVRPAEQAEISNEAVPSPHGGRRDRLRRLLLGVTLVVGLAATVVAGLVAIAPVEATTSTISWPRAGEEPEPTTAFLVPYRPAQLQAAVPCTALREASRASTETTVLATTTTGASSGLAIRTVKGTPRLLAGGRAEELALPDGDCTLRVDADAAGLRAAVDDRTVVDLPGDPVPEVFAITTDLRGDAAAGLSFRARTPSWFDNARTPEKSALLELQFGLAGLALTLLAVLGVVDRSGPARDARGATLPRVSRALRRRLTTLRRPRTWALAALDVGVVVAVSWWSVVGPLTDDDGFAALIARAAADGGPVGNYVRWFDASEAPFATSQMLVSLVVDRGVDALTLRLPSVFAGIALWFLVTRGVLPALGRRAGAGVGVRLLTVVALGVWWLPYDLGTRPESFVATGVTAVLVLVLRAVRADARHPLPCLGLAAGVAALTVTVAPSGLLGLAPFLLTLPRLGRLVRGEHAGPAAAGRVAAVLAALAGVAAVAVVVVFARQSWHGLLVATSIHQQFGPSQPWYAEWLRYSYLLGQDSWGSAGKRLPVLLMVATAPAAVALLARRGRAALDPRASEPVLLLLGPVGLALLAVTPSKWSHHFGALAGFGAVSLVAVVVAFARLASGPEPGRTLRATGAGTALGVVVAAAAAFSGPNAWWGYSNAHMPWATTSVSPFDSPVLWLAAGAVATAVVSAGVVAWRRRSGGVPGRLAVASAVGPAALAVLAAATSVAVLAGSFAVAATPPRGGWSLGAANLAAARDPGAGAACALQDRVQVITTANGGPLVPQDRSDEGDLDGFEAGGGWDDPPPARPGQDDEGTRDDTFAWGSKDVGPTGVGTLTSPWFTLPTPRAGQELALSVAGRTEDGASVVLEYGRSGPDTVTPQGTRRLLEPPAPERGYRGFAPDPQRAELQDRFRDVSTWRTLTVPADTIPARTDRVRVVARDDRTDERGWVAVTGPRLVDVTPITEYLADRGRVLVDWTLALAWPCLRDLATVGRGLATTPGALILAPPGPTDPVGGRLLDDGAPGDIVPEVWTGGGAGLSTGTDVGGSFAGASEAGDLEEADTRLAGEPGRVWGRLVVPDYDDLARDAYDARSTTTRIAGTDGDPPPVREPQTDFAP
ncbi:arabinosyltransferase C [Actinomycetospora succinea]|uniref:Arabinosyltransferase C n=1 Tax=Actinomycetospora succinea TaxID=663603 RepID=A0A4V3DB46_9PSEU|nr:arabinosyltransferase domain-containing protein [Actinomycetospora succinea]TDQ65158.1 arabinosyltransferase C [Actinomycetospora succinea]